MEPWNDAEKQAMGVYFNGLVRRGAFQTEKWQGRPIAKNPFDLIVMQEIVFETKPTLLIETGTWCGGSALFFSHVFKLMGVGRVITVDISSGSKLEDGGGIKYITGSSINEDIFNQIKGEVRAEDRVMVCLDSNHMRGHVLEEMKLYGNIVTVGCYMVVEDGCVGGHPIPVSYDGGPYAAIEEFMAGDDRFEVDEIRERFLMTCNPMGYLRRSK